MSAEETGEAPARLETRQDRAPAALLALALTLLVMLVSLTGCGGGERQDANAPSGTWQVAVEEWKFPKHQYLGTPVEFVVKVRNTDTREIPDLILTINGMKTRVKQQAAANDVRPIWMTTDVDYARVTPYNSALAESWNLGPLKAGEVATYSVELTPLRRGWHTVGYRLSPALFGDGKIVNGSDQSPAADTRSILIDPTPQFDEKIFKD